MSDRTRQLTVTAAETFCVFGTLVGFGVIGNRVQDSANGALAADATLLAPAGPAFSIWSVIYLGLLAYTVWQWLPGQTSHPRHRAIGWWAAAAMALNATWILVTQQGWLWTSVVVIVVLALCLGALMRQLAVHSAAGTRHEPLDQVIVDGTFGLYLGWVAIATCANITATLVAAGVEPSRGAAEVIAALVIVAALGILEVVRRATGTRWAVGLAAAWGLAWIAIGRLQGDPHSSLVGTVATMAAGLVVVWLFLTRDYRATSAASFSAISAKL